MAFKVSPLTWRRCPRRWSRSACCEPAMAATNIQSSLQKIPSWTATTTTSTRETQNTSGDGVSINKNIPLPTKSNGRLYYLQKVTKKWQQKTWRMSKSCTRNSIDGSCDCVIYLCQLNCSDDSASFTLEQHGFVNLCTKGCLLVCVRRFVVCILEKE